MSTILFILLCVFNILTALGLKLLFDDSPLVKNKPLRLFLLIPPVAIVSMLAILAYGVIWTVYLLFDDYLS